MTQDQALLLAYKVVLVAVVVTVALWTAVYSYLARWWKSPIGKTVVDFAVKVAAAMVPFILSLFFHLNRTTSRAAGWADVGVFAWISAGMLRRIPLWVRLHIDRTGHQTYTGILPFLAQVTRRRGRPVWKDWPAGPGTEAGDTAAGNEPGQGSGPS